MATKKTSKAKPASKPAPKPSAKDSKKCSIDQFAYVPINKEYLFGSLSNKWSLQDARIDDIKTFEFFYENESKGLALHALDLTPTRFDKNELNEWIQVSKSINSNYPT